MTSQRHSNGYCLNCCKNVPHVRVISNGLIRYFDILSLRCMRRFGFGPWHCVHCERKVLKLIKPDPDAPEYHSAALDPNYPVLETPSAFLPAKPSRSSLVVPHSTSPSINVVTPLENEPSAIPVGNYLRSDSSLLMRSARLNRFSEKYRDAVVRRILSGMTTITRVREDKQLSDTEITGWIADLFERQQKRIDSLENAVRSIPLLDQEQDNLHRMPCDPKIFNAHRSPR